MVKAKKNSAKPENRPKDPQHPAGVAKAIPFAIIVLLAVTNLVTYLALSGKLEKLHHDTERARESGDKLRDFKVVNGHDHIYKREHLDKYLKAAEKTGVVRTLFVASSARTLIGKKGGMDQMNEWSSEELLRIAREFPDKIIPFCTIYPGDPEKLDKLKKYVAEGAKGLKLYSGHTMFHDQPLDVEDMMPVYAYCEETGLPICWHVRLDEYGFRIGIGDEFLRVMERFPNLTVIIPHFGVTFFHPEAKSFKAFQRLLDKYPNLYTDTSFGTRQILVDGLEAVSRNRAIFRDFFERYSDRIFLGTDMVVTGNKEKTEQWIEAVIRACRDVLEKDEYHFFMATMGSRYARPRVNNTYGRLRGLALDDDILRKVYETNIEKLFPSE